jgi:pseudomonalisin
MRRMTRQGRRGASKRSRVARLVAGGLLPAAMVAGPLVTQGSAAAAPSWAATATRGLKLVDATDLGRLGASTPMRVSVALRPRNSSGLRQLIRAEATPGSTLYGESITPAQFVSRFGPSLAEVGAVESYLHRQGFGAVSASSNRLLVTASGTAAQAESAFHTSLSAYRQFGRTVYANTTAAMVPGALGGDVSAVLGLDDAARMQARPDVVGPALPKPKTDLSAPVYDVSYTPQGFWQAYDVGRSSSGYKTSIAIFAEGDLASVTKDLREEEDANRLPQVDFSIVRVGLASPDTSGADEWDLDTQYSTGMAATVKHLYIYDTTSLTDSDIAREFNAFASQDVAKAGSASFGECESEAYADGSMLVDDMAFAEAAAQGQTVFASSGDTGGSCAVAPTNGVPSSGPPEVNYPASSPYVVGVGGTTLLTNPNGSYYGETAWSAGGGGISDLETSPYWQSGIVPSAEAGQRGVPDVAMDADPYSGATVYVGGKPEAVGGTSLSSPLALGVWARIESTYSNGVGFASPVLYSVYRHGTCSVTSPLAVCSTPAFHDITVGTNGTYFATPGWDYTTGIGTFNVANAVRLVK